MITLHCTGCGLIFSGEVTDSYEVPADSPEARQLEGGPACPDCGTPLLEVAANQS
jgi:rubredoxin